MRTWYQASEDYNEYGEETVRIKGVYATSVGDDTPILTRLTQWKIVAKRAVDLAPDLQGAPAPSWSSVNNCTGRSGSEDPNQPVSFDSASIYSLTRKERRRILKEMRAEKPQKSRRVHVWSDRIEAACKNLITQIGDYTGDDISRGLAV